MKRLFMITLVILSALKLKSQWGDFDSYPVYKGDDLGLSYSARQSIFRIWAPTAEQARLVFYSKGTGGERTGLVEMVKDENGTWKAVMEGDQKGKFYAFSVRIRGQWLHEVPDPYAKAVGVNGKRALVADLSKTNPSGWEHDKSPSFINETDAVIYELHVRDASVHASSGIKSKGKFLGLTESGTKNREGLSTGLDHIREMGVTHVHLLPCFDFLSIDETKPDKTQYNWGYDPLNYNVPEGSYSTDPYDGLKRIIEFKKLVQTFHQNGIRVIMDVVYNHTGLTEDSYFNQLVPGYYYRHTQNGGFSNATACGNETASERYIMRKFMLESVLYWVKEYHIDGFRFDLMGVHDMETMNLISEELHKIKPGILLYGEGWTAGPSPLADSLRALKKFAFKLNKVAVFSDDIRDGIKGHVFEHEQKGFVSGNADLTESVKFGITASCKHAGIDYKKVNYSNAPYAAGPWNTISYVDCHDNLVLWDKLAACSHDASVMERTEMSKLALSIVLTSQGIPFLHAGTEFLRTKKGVDNSFESPDSINAIDWGLKAKNKQVYDYARSLIRMRKDHPVFRMNSADEIRQYLSFEQELPVGVIAYTLYGQALGDSWKKVFVIFNGSREPKDIIIPPGKWHVAVSDNKFPAKEKKVSKHQRLMPAGCTILYQ